MSYCVRLHERRCWGVIDMAGGIGQYRQGDRLLLLRKTARRGRLVWGRRPEFGLSRRRHLPAARQHGSGSGEGSHALAASLDNRGTRERSLQGALQAYSKAVGYEPPKVEAAEEAEVEAEAGEEAMEEVEGE